MNSSPVPVPSVNPDFRILDIAQVAARCGVTPETIQHWLKHERFPRPMRHARLIWLLAEVDAFLAERADLRGERS